MTDIDAIFGGFWEEVRDGDARARFLFRRHYTCRRYRDGRRPRLFVGPGEKMVLLTHRSDALRVWRKFRSMDGQRGVNCAVFRNESAVLSSALLREACELAWRRWPGGRLYTYVDPRKVRGTNPGFCFRVAGWRRCGRTKRRELLILERVPGGDVIAGRLDHAGVSGGAPSRGMAAGDPV